MTDDNDAFEFLERLEISTEDIITRERFQSKLRERFRDAGMGKPTEKQTDVLFQIADETRISFPNSGITRVLSRRFTGNNSRFGIKGQRGLFGITKALQFLRGRR